MARPPASRVALAIAAPALLLSCATVPSSFAPDPNAKAPQLTGFGHSDIAVTTRVPAARALFNQGVLQAYAFNEREAVRMFKAALAADPACAMCAWGVAWQLGPNINNDSRDEVAEALKYVGHATRHLGGATPRERALVESLALRYAHASAARETAPLTAATCGEKDGDKTHPLDQAYADRMRALADQYPRDADILSLYAEAELIVTDAWPYWNTAGQPAGRVGEVTQKLERLLPAHPDHTGLNHYLIHAADALAAAPRAVAAADKLRTLAPAAPHLVHMPAHTYAHVGRYADAARVNEAALAAEAAQVTVLESQGFTTSKDWRLHNQHFHWYAALMQGREDAALASADALATLMERGSSPYAEYMRSLRLVTLVRLERWDRVLKEARPRGDRGMAAIWHEHARGVAQARLGKPDEAQAALGRLQAAVPGFKAAHATSSLRHKIFRAMADTAEANLQAEIALAKRQFDDAIAHQQRAVRAAVPADVREPPLMADGTRLVLAQMQGRAGRWRDAEASYRRALADHPASGWAQRGLAEALQAQGKRAEAEAVRKDLEKSWGEASAHLKAAG